VVGTWRNPARHSPPRRGDRACVAMSARNDAALIAVHSGSAAAPATLGHGRHPRAHHGDEL